jgi:hypothetical protein
MSKRQCLEFGGGLGDGIPSRKSGRSLPVRIGLGGHLQSGAVRVDISANAVFRFTGSIVLGLCHSVGGK